MKIKVLKEYTVILYEDEIKYLLGLTQNGLSKDESEKEYSIRKEILSALSEVLYPKGKNK